MILIEDNEVKGFLYVKNFDESTETCIVLLEFPKKIYSIYVHVYNVMNIEDSEGKVVYKMVGPYMYYKVTDDGTVKSNIQNRLCTKTNS